ncbi:MAG: acetate kinase [Clostridia bacterium]|nr:acetate kinase [Clostridia bacterium]
MKVLVLNCGSSSLKYQLIDMDKKEVLAKGNYERIGEDEAFLTHKVNGEKYVIKKGVHSHDEALKGIMEQLLSKEYGVIASLNEIGAVGHRIVHGGEIFSGPAKINETVINQIAQCGEFAPLHNPAAVLGIRACIELMPNTPMVAVFDTAFHQTMPKENYLYPIPIEYYEKLRVRKYGAHGTSHSYVSKRAAALMNRNIKELKIVTCHLGQGASLCAIKEGKCIDTSMGLTPLGGIAMVTRSGDLDPSVVTYIMDKEKIAPNDMNAILNKKSGLSAISKMPPDFREIEANSSNNPDAKTAINIFNSTVAQYIARYAVKLGGLDVIVFTGGIGENQANVREAICNQLEFMGVEINKEKNKVKGEEAEISDSTSKIKVFVIPTDEEMMIAQETIALI